MPAGTLCAINPGVVHAGCPATSQGWRYRMFYPSPALVARTLEDYPAPRLSVGSGASDRHVIDDPELFREFEALHVSSQLRETLLERQTRIAVFLRRLFDAMAMFRPKAGRARVVPRTAAIVRDYLHANAESEISIADLAQAAGVSGTQVIRAFSAETGMPPQSYLVSLRVERAKASLRAGTSPAGTALEVNFSNQSQLTRHFKRLTGMTPGRFAAEASPRTEDKNSSAVGHIGSQAGKWGQRLSHCWRLAEGLHVALLPVRAARFPGGGSPRSLREDHPCGDGRRAAYAAARRSPPKRAKSGSNPERAGAKS